MLWLWFTIGLLLTISGSFLMAYGDDIDINGHMFDGEVLGVCLLSIGGILAGLMLLALGINWCFRGC